MATEIQVITSSDRVESILEDHRDAFGEDFDAYRSHCYRTITYAMHFLDGDDTQRPLVDTALAFHDLSLWADDALGYLEPSEERAVEANRVQGWGLDDQALRDAIHWHHKLTPFRGDHAEVVNACRRADWIDATAGVVRMGVPRREIRRVREAIPMLEFQRVLQRRIQRLGGGTVPGGVRILRRILKP